MSVQSSIQTPRLSTTRDTVKVRETGTNNVFYAFLIVVYQDVFNELVEISRRVEDVTGAVITTTVEILNNFNIDVTDSTGSNRNPVSSYNAVKLFASPTDQQVLAKVKSQPDETGVHADYFNLDGSVYQGDINALKLVISEETNLPIINVKYELANATTNTWNMFYEVNVWSTSGILILQQYQDSNATVYAPTGRVVDKPSSPVTSGAVTVREGSWAFQDVVINNTEITGITISSVGINVDNSVTVVHNEGVDVNDGFVQTSTVNLESETDVLRLILKVTAIGKAVAKIFYRRRQLPTILIVGKTDAIAL